MARHNIPLKDKAIVKARIARGLSYDKAKEGTAIRSDDTVMRLVRKESREIGELRKEYLAMIRGFGGDDETKAKALAKMLKATKLCGKKAIKHPDHRARLEAIEYIDKLSELLPEAGGTTINILNDPKFIARYE